MRCIISQVIRTERRQSSESPRSNNVSIGGRALFEQLKELEARYQETADALAEPQTASDPERFRQLMKQQADLMPLIETYRLYRKTGQDITEYESLLETEKDEEMRTMLKEELALSKSQQSDNEQKLKILLLPKDPNDDRNVVMEIRAGVGGDEAALFAAQLYRMYSRFADRNRWKTELVSFNENGIGGLKEIIFMIAGRGAYSRLKYESGVHRVQRVPVTESQGRIQTSAATVAVLPEAEDVDVEINMNDCRFDVFRASGNGGQCVNTTDSAVRLTHLPTGIVISCQDEKSQIKNKAKALRVLRTKLYVLKQSEAHEEQAETRRSMVGGGDRSEKIRTYHFPQGRVTDHRIKYTSHRIDAIMDGDLFELTDALQAADQAEKLLKLQEVES